MSSVKSSPPSALPAEREAGLSSGFLPVRRAADRVAESHAHWAGDATGPDEIADLLDAIVAAVGDPHAPVGDGLRCVIGRRLLELVQSETLRGVRGLDDPPTTAELLETLEAFERVREAIQPDWDQYFASRLAGPGGLELVVEVAHDLRSPLTSILFLAETLQRGQSGEVNDLQHRQLGLIYSAALGLSTLASNVIELAREGTRLADDEPQPFSTGEILESIYDIVQPMAQEKNLTIRLLPPTGDLRVGHAQALSRVLLNLTTNAIKFTEEGFVEIVGRAKGPTWVEFSVRDTGNGINPQAVATLYSPFRRAPTGDRYAFSDTGLGLALCRKLVEVMGSELQVETKPKWGTRFYFDLDLPPA